MEMVDEADLLTGNHLPRRGRNLIAGRRPKDDVTCSTANILGASVSVSV